MAGLPVNTFAAASNSDPWRGAVSVVPADTDIVPPARGVRADGAGTLVVTFADGTGPFTLNVAAGEIVPGFIKRVAAASTATGILGGV
jgi:hypothetical protein